MMSIGNKTSKTTQLKFYKTVAIPSLLYEGECWILRRKMNFLCEVKWSALLDHVRNKKGGGLGDKPILTQVMQHREMWGDYL
jgi:hypothetical protein